MEETSRNGTALTSTPLENRFSVNRTGEESNSARSSPSVCAGSGSNGSVSDNEKKIFVGGLSWLTTDKKLGDYFSQFGTVTKQKVMMDPISQRSRGFGFITFKDPVVPCVLAVPEHTLDGKIIDPKPATKSTPNKTKKVFVGGVSQGTSVEEIAEHFSQFGKIKEAIMLMDQYTNKHRGFGFVTFDEECIVDRICEIQFHTIKGKKVECKKARPKKASLKSLSKRSTMILPFPAATSLPVRSWESATLGSVAMKPAVAAAAAANYSNLMSARINHPSLGNYRYTPYPLPNRNATNSNVIPSDSTRPIYGAYTLPAPVDASGLQNINWSPWSHWPGFYNTRSAL